MSKSGKVYSILWKKCFFIICLTITILSACNPKPIIQEEIVEHGQMEAIPQLEKLKEIPLVFPDNQSLLQGLERLSTYMGLQVTNDIKFKVYQKPDSQEYLLTDLIHALAENGLYILYLEIEPDVIYEEIKKGRPILVRNSFSGSITSDGLFYGFDDAFFYYYQLPSMAERKIPITKLTENIKAGKSIEAFLVTEKPEQWLEELLGSHLYLTRWGQDVYYKKEKEAYKKFIEVVERKQWRLGEEDRNQLYAYYYIFYDPQPEKVRSIILNSYQDQHFLPASQELAFMLYRLTNEQEEAEKVLQNMNLGPNQLSFYQDGTLFQIGLFYLEKGEKQMAHEILISLKNRNPDYEGLEEVLKQTNS